MGIWRLRLFLSLISWEDLKKKTPQTWWQSCAVIFFLSDIECANALRELRSNWYIDTHCSTPAYRTPCGSVTVQWDSAWLPIWKQFAGLMGDLKMTKYKLINTVTLVRPEVVTFWRKTSMSTRSWHSEWTPSQLGLRSSHGLGSKSPKHRHFKSYYTTISIRFLLSKPEHRDFKESVWPANLFPLQKQLYRAEKMVRR